jgi:hypothetical protein
VLPATLTQLRATARHASPHDTAAAQELVARGYWVAGCTLVHLGASDASWLAILQALAAANCGADELLAAVLRGSVSWQLLVQSRFDEACRVARRAAAAIEPAAVGAASLAHRPAATVTSSRLARCCRRLPRWPLSTAVSTAPTTSRRSVGRRW